MDEERSRGYEARGRTRLGGRSRRRGERCVSAPFSAHCPIRFLGGQEQREESFAMASIDSLKARRELTVGDKTYVYYSLPAAEEAGLGSIARLPVSMKVLLENLLRNEDNDTVTPDDLKAIAAWLENKGATEHEISFR